MKKLILLLLIPLIIISFKNYKKISHNIYDELCDFNLIKNQNLIIKNLWLGNHKSSVDKDFLTKNNIKLIINLSKDLPFTDLENIDKFRVAIHDNRSQESDIGMIQNFHHCYSLIDNKLSNNQSVLIHCRAGMQRSAALLALYLMRKNNYSFDKAKSIIKKERCIAFYPVVNFIGPIRYFEAKFY